MINVIIAIKNPLCCEMIKQWLTIPKFYLSVVSDKKEIRMMIKNTRPDLIIIDDDFYEPITIEFVRVFNCSAKLIFFGGLASPECTLKMIRKGIDGFLDFNVTQQEALELISRTYNFGYALNPATIEALIRVARKLPERFFTVQAIAGLTEKENTVFRMLYEGQTNQEISEKLNLSVETIKTYRKKIYRKTGCHSLPKLLRFAEEHKLFVPDNATLIAQQSS